MVRTVLLIFTLIFQSMPGGMMRVCTAACPISETAPVATDCCTERAEAEDSCCCCTPATPVNEPSESDHHDSTCASCASDAGVPCKGLCCALVDQDLGRFWAIVKMPEASELPTAILPPLMVVDDAAFARLPALVRINTTRGGVPLRPPSQRRAILNIWTI